MEHEFYIHPSSCMAQTDNMEQAARKLDSCAVRLEAVKNQISQLGGSYGNVVASLDSLIREVNRDKKGMDNLRDTLIQCVNCYVETEKKIAGSMPEKGKIQHISNSFDYLFPEWMLKINDIRGKEWAVLLESFMLKGVFGDNVLKSVRKIMEGTYIVSQRVDGKLFLKLHQNGMTNAQISTWLKDNIGGNWDDYRSRNMKDFNFSVYDYIEGKYTRTGRYFDNLTDVELNQYLKNLEGSSFTKTLKSNFNLLDDFNYKGIKEMDHLSQAGKVIGTAGTVFTIGGDVVDNFYDPVTRTWSFSGNQAADCAWDIGVDLAAGAGSTAVGAAVGSLIVPPVGTVVGAGVGMAVDAVANNVKIWDVDGDGQKDSFVDAVKIGGHAAIDWVGDKAGDVCDWLGDVFSF